MPNQLQITALALLPLCLGPTAGNGCHSSLDCRLNGDCIDGNCVCDPAWSGAPDCSKLSFLKLDKASPFGYFNKTESSWGGNIIKDDEGKYHLFHSQFLNNCGM